MTEDGEKLICCKCNVPLELIKTNFKYMRHGFAVEVPKCPQCGQVYISEELVKSKVVAVEQLLEDK
jgi:hypothetical protein